MIGRKSRLTTIALSAVLLAAAAATLQASAEENTAPTKDNKMTSAASWKQYQAKSDKELKGMLTPEQFRITRKNGTEPAFRNEYWDNKKPGLYVDVISGKPLFSSKDKFESGTGWPSFTGVVDKSEIVEKADNSFFSRRTEVHSKTADAHLGHVFPDGPAPTGMRYCINSAALKFVPLEKLADEGYGEYLKLFEGK